MATSMVENCMKEIQENGEPGQALNDLVKAIHAKELSLVTLVEALGPYLTHKNPEERYKGTQLLALGLHRLSSFQLLEQEVNFLVNFFCDRFRDHYSVTPHVLSGLLALVSYQVIPDDCAIKIVQVFFKEVHTQSLVQTDRYNIYTLLGTLINTSTTALQKLEGEFVFGFIQAMDGEKDPRNLLLAFQLVPIIIRNFSIRLFAEDLFEVTSCYFPIDFSPPENDPNFVTKDQLVSSLRSCLSATSLFAPYCFPLLIEKLSSDIVYAKKDALLTISACANNYDSRSIKEFLIPLWNNIRTELFTAGDNSIELACFEALKSIVRNLSAAQQRDNSDDLKEFITKILNESKEHFSKPEHKLMRTSSSLLQTVASVSELACCQIIDQVLPLLLEQFEANRQVSNQKAILDGLLGFLQVAKDFVKKDTPGVLFKHKDKLIGLFFPLLTNHSPLHRSSSIAGLVALTSSSLFTNDQVVEFLNHLLNIILHDAEKIVRYEAKLAVTYLTSEFPELASNHVVTPLLEKLAKQRDKDLSQDVPHLTHEYLITTLSTLCTSSSHVHLIVPHLVQDLAKWAKITIDQRHRNMTDTLNGLQTICEASLRNSLKNIDFFKDAVFPNLLMLPVENALRENEACFPTELLGKFTKLTRTICSNLLEKSCVDVVNIVQDLFLDNKLFQGDNSIEQMQFHPLKVSSPWQQTQLVTLLTAILCCILKSVNVPRLQEFLKKLVILAMECDHKHTNIEAAKCFAGLINRIANETKVDEEVAKFLGIVEPVLKESKEECKKWRATIVLIWVTKALLIRGHSRGMELLKMLLDLFSDPNIGQVCADGFYIIMSTPEDVMTSSSCANIKMMYKQRIFIEVSPLLTEGFNSSEKDYKHLYLCALSHILHWLPKQVLLGEIPTLLPLLVQSLSCEENLQLSTMETLYSLTHDVPKLIANYLTSLVPKYLHLGQNACSLKVRSMALRSLGVLTVLPHHNVFPYKSEVVRTLLKCLDDHKRLVRKEAVKCRNEWILLGVAVD